MKYLSITLLSFTAVCGSALCAQATGRAIQSPLIAGSISSHIATDSVPASNIAAEHTSERVDSISSNNIPGYDDLDEVTVTAKKPVIQTAADKLIYNTEEDAASSTSNVLEAMRKVPLLSVDADDNLKLKGEGNFKIYLNGKPDPALSANYKEILKAMPASTVKKIEVWTAPGAKYDAEGTGGIINIVTISTTKLYGFTSTVEGTVNNRRVTGSVSAMTKVNNVTASVNYSHTYNFDQKFSMRQNTTYLDNPVDHLLSNTMDMSYKGNFDNASLQLSWEPDTANLVAVSANLFSYRSNNPMDMQFSMQDINGEQRWAYNGDVLSHANSTGLTAGVNYQHNFSRPDHNIVASYQYNYGLNHSKNRNLYYDFSNFDALLQPSSLTDTRYPSHEHTFQLDYTLPLGNVHALETGAKYILRRNYGDSHYSILNDGVWIEDESRNVKMTQFQDVAAVYGAYTGHFEALTAKAGLRYEYTHMGANFKTPGYTNFSTDLNDIVPNLGLTWGFKDGSMLSAAYQLRISRPSVSQLNPYRDTGMPLNVYYGNPSLSSQKLNGVTLTYSNFSLPVGLNFTASYNRISDLIVNYQFLENDVINKTYGNIGSGDEFNVFGFMRWAPVRNLVISVNGGAYYKNYTASKASMHNDGWGWNVGGNVDWTLPYDMQVSLFGGAGNSGPQIQDDGTNWHYDGLAFSKFFLKENRLKVSLSAMGVIAPSISIDQTTKMEGAVTTMNMKGKIWTVGLSVSYRFGTLRSQMKRTAKTIENDDVLSGGSSSTPSAGGMQR